MTKRSPSLSRLVKRLDTLCHEIEEQQIRVRDMGLEDVKWLIERAKKSAMDAVRRMREIEAERIRSCGN